MQAWFAGWPVVSLDPLMVRVLVNRIGWPNRARNTGLVRGVATRIPRSLMVRMVAKRTVRPSRALVTGLVRGVVTARDGKRSLCLNDSEVFVPS